MLLGAKQVLKRWEQCYSSTTDSTVDFTDSTENMGASLQIWGCVGVNAQEFGSVLLIKSLAHGLHVWVGKDVKNIPLLQDSPVNA
jgi:hypothetical protein